MDMLYARYSCPMDLVKSYIRRRRFGEFVQGFIEAEVERRKEEADKMEYLIEWIGYVHSATEKSFKDWRADLIGTAETKKKTAGKSDRDLDAAGIDAIMHKVFG